MNFDEIMDKIRDGAAVAADLAEQAVDNAKKGVKRSLDTASLNVKMGRISVAIQNEYASIGELVYKAHIDPGMPPDDIEEILVRLDSLHFDLNALKEERDRRRDDE